MTDQDHLRRIDALTQNARSTWFALLAALVFVGITLMGVEHIDFYGVDRATSLPLVNFEVPTRYFFVAAPVLTAAVYSYFHLNLIRLWDALGAAPARVGGVRLGDAVSPWLVSDAALDVRARYRKDNSTRRRALEGPATLLNLVIGWGFGLIVLAFLWHLSLPARSFAISVSAGTALVVSLIVGLASLTSMMTRMRHPEQVAPVALRLAAGRYAVLALLTIAIGGLTYVRTEGETETLARLDLTGEALVVRPAGWLLYEDAKREFRADWCRREYFDGPCDTSAEQDAAYQFEFETRRAAARSDMRRADWDTPGVASIDFRNATLFNAFLVGANLSGADLSQADMSFAQMEGANFSGAQMTETRLYKARMEQASLIQTTMDRAILGEANLMATELIYTRLMGTRDRVTSLQGTDLRGSVMMGGMIRYVELSGITFDEQTDFRNVFLDGSVSMTPELRAQMGYPCQWVDRELTDDAEYYGYWRGWVETAPAYIWPMLWEFVAPEPFRNVPAIAPPEGCMWHLEQMPAFTR
ncbi:MAG: pentapeptide repeat-containing protein [Pseudomonadota bacterium]